MGILERLTRPAKAPRERFADEVLAELRRIGVRSLDYRPSQYAIVCDAGRDASNWLFLAKAFTQYEKNPGDRKRFVREFVASSLAPPPSPPTFEAARAELRIMLRHAGAGPALLRRPALPYLDEVVLAGGAALGAGQPQAWQVSAEEVFATARAATLSNARLPEIAAFFGPSVLHVPDYSGANLVSWVLLDGWLAELGEQLGGRAVAFLPSALMLLITVDEPRLVAQLFELAEEEYGRSSRRLSPMAYTTDLTGRVAPYEPPAGHPAHQAAQRARRRLMTDVVERQRLALDDPALAECTFATRADGTALTATIWTVGSVALLPEADFVGLEMPGERPFFVPWPVLVEADLLIEEIDYRPTRHRVLAVVPPAALGYLRERAVAV